MVGALTSVKAERTLGPASVSNYVRDSVAAWMSQEEAARHWADMRNAGFTSLAFPNWAMFARESKYWARTWRIKEGDAYIRVYENAYLGKRFRLYVLTDKTDHIIYGHFFRVEFTHEEQL